MSYKIHLYSSQIKRFLGYKTKVYSPKVDELQGCTSSEQRFFQSLETLPTPRCAHPSTGGDFPDLGKRGEDTASTLCDLCGLNRAAGTISFGNYVTLRFQARNLPVFNTAPPEASPYPTSPNTRSPTLRTCLSCKSRVSRRSLWRRRIKKLPSDVGAQKNSRTMSGCFQLLVESKFD